MTLRFVQTILLLASLTMGSQLYSQSQAFEAGYQAYMRNQFPVAEAHFKRALSTAKTREDRAFILKFLGISQYMRGDRKQAASSFYQAHVNDQKTSIYQEEVLDPTVVDFYNSLKLRWVQAQAKQQQEQAKDTTAPNLPSNRSSAESKGERPVAAGQSLTKADRPRSTQRSQPLPKDQGKDLGEETSSSSISWLHFMPFGTGQFYNGQYFSGGFFLGTQIFASATYIRRNRQISDETSKKNRVSGLESGDAETKAEFFLLIDDRISLLEKEASYAILGFGLSWGVGVLHAILSRPNIVENDVAGLIPRSLNTLNLKEHESLDYWYINKSPSQKLFAISPRPKGGWLLKMSMDLP